MTEELKGDGSLEALADALKELMADISRKEPAILTANTWRWHPNQSASGRRSAEKRRLQEVAAYFLALGGEVMIDSEQVVGDWTIDGEAIRARFVYEESRHHVYKRLDVTRNGNRSTIRAIRKIAARAQREGL